MEAAKRKLLEQTHKIIIEEGFKAENPERVLKVTSPNVIGLGTTYDEKIVGLKETKALFKRQKEQGKGLSLRYELTNLGTHISKDENTAIFIDEIDFSITTNDETIAMSVRFSTVLEYIKNQWLLVHWHSSKPEDVESEKDTWGIETWKERAEELEKEVAERTADLVQKNRDLAIEAALERVRSRSMAMHSSDELKEVVAVLFENLKELQIPVTAAGIQIYLEDSEDMLNYVCGENSEGLVISHYRLPYFDNAIINDFKNARQSEEGFFVGNYSKKTKDSFYTYLFDNTEIKDVPEDIKQMIFDSRAYTISIAPVSNSLIAINDFQGNQLSEYHVAIIKRFAKVFEQAYIRFRDLQKAEAQAREAQIQLSLERVRAKSMAMQSSDELHEVIGIVFQQFDNLAIQPVNVFLSLFDREKRMLTYRASGKSGKRMPTKQDVDIDSVEAWTDLYNKWINDSSDDIEVIFYPKEIVPDILNLLKDTFLAMPKKDRMTIKDFPKGGYSTLGYTPFGYLGYDHTRPPTEEEKDILKRICTEFGRVYQRFLDIKKAEAQAREAQIEAALERVRAQTMAMHSSDELESIIQVVYDQFVGLGITLDHSGFIMDYKTNDDMIIWLADEHKVTPQIRLPYFDSPHWKSFLEAKEKGFKLFVNHLDFKEKNKFYKQIFKYVPELPEEAKDFYRKVPSLTIATALTDDIGLYIENFSGTQYQEQDQKILLRFAEVFQQAYTRFRDLQKAEAQAREAQIEAALERVRSASMAMHKTEDISEVVTVLFDQLNHLNVPFLQIWITILNLDKDYIDIWMSPVEGVYATSQHFTMPSLYFEDTAIKTWRSKAPFSYRSLKSNAEVDEFINACDAMTESTYFSHSRKIQNYNQLEFIEARHEYGFISKSNTEPPTETEANILQRFAKVFEQAYTRFLDIEKAEAQAREAQIEAALERIRAKAMAMHNSSELTDVLTVFFEQFDILEINPTWAHLSLIDLEENTFTYRMTGPKGRRHMAEQKISLNARTEWQDAIETFKKADPNTVSLLHFPKKVLPQVWDLFSETINSFPAGEGFNYDDFPEGLYNVQGNCKFGFIGFNHSRPATEEEKDIVVRFAKEFGRLYQRFLDIEKAEEQAREAQIEASLERVRAKAMAMHHTDELSDVLCVLFDQFDLLGINPVLTHLTLFDEPNETFSIRLTTTADKGIVAEQLIDLYAIDAWKQAFEQWKSSTPNSISTIDYNPEDLPYVWDLLSEVLNALPEGHKIRPTDFPGGLFTTQGHFDFGYIGYNHSRRATEEEKEIVGRFAREFGRTYQRFLDLQKAEAQAREAQIEMALEKVRSRTMAMQNSSELPEAANNLFLQVQELGIPAWSAGYCIWEDDQKSATAFMSSEGVIQKPFVLPTIGVGYNFSEPLKKREVFHVEELGGKLIKKHYEFMRTLPIFGEVIDSILEAGHPLPTFQIFHICYFKYGYVMFITYETVTKAHDIFKRFSKVFEQTYTRFLDLQKSEEQTREAKIEASLERVRAKTMAMHRSEDLSEVATVLFEQISLLTNTPSRFNIAILNEEEKLFDIWVTDQKGQNLNNLFVFDVRKSEIVAEVFEAFKAKKRNIIQHMSGKRLENWVEYASKQAGVPFDKKNIKEDRYINSIFFKHGCIGITTDEMPSESVIQLLERFTQVFEQTYTRFLDLQKAEAQARESQIEAALEKVRSRSLEMSESSEMQKVANEIQKQVRAVGLKIDALAMSGVIDNESDYDVWVGGANSKKPLRIPYNNETQVQLEFNKAIKERPGFFTKTYTGKVMKEYFNALMGTGNSFNPEIVAFMKTCTGFTTTLTFMKNSGIQLIRYSEEPFSKEDNAIVVRFGKVFEQAYIRFLDLQKAEEQTVLAQQNLIKLKAQKQRAEEALSELQQTQTQLIQSEKMAGLGELTAGIAHEIQNPLNFVNNFSEVSKELLQEMLEEMANGDVEEVKAIANDISQNLEKINHHGKRADGIVKGMLQHSRSSTGTKEPTNINALADEYLRLAYHGLRAKDKSFNADLVTDFDDSIGNIKVIPQDMGRVILNLITNAFYASNERKQNTKDEAFKPIVSVSTKKNKNSIEIKVKDNGNGIPKHIIDKIFQPFFTTKPTGQGTGLGLSMSYDIVTKGHGGELKVESQGDEGTTFCISIPKKSNL